MPATEVSKFEWLAVDLDRLERLRQDSSAEIKAAAKEMIERIRLEGESAVRRLSARFGDIDSKEESLVIDSSQLQESLEKLEREKRGVLERTADRIRNFALAQRDSLKDCKVEVPGGVAGHRWSPLTSAGCYAPGGRYPLPSSVLMTAVTAKVAGVDQVWVASPRPTVETCAAAAISGADGLLAVGGVQAIATMTFGTINPIPCCDVIVGPGNRWVTAAKAIVADQVRIDMLAGPSELVIVADESADSEMVAADMLAQAEHDTDASAILVTDSKTFADSVASQIGAQLKTLPTGDTAVAAMQNGGFIIVDDVREAISVCQRLAPEHLSLQGKTVEPFADSFNVCGSLFIGSVAGEVLGDYGVGPNHVLPTGGTARFQNPLWVGSFMRFHTYTKMSNRGSCQQIVTDAKQLARMEGLEAHARSAEKRQLSD